LCRNADAGVPEHGVLIPVSGSYPPVRCRMHTLYAHVRHSLPSENGIPSDLHVLCLPLAFILSQDQTIHCKVFFDGAKPSLAPSGHPDRVTADGARPVVLSHSTSMNFLPFLAKTNWGYMFSDTFTERDCKYRKKSQSTYHHFKRFF